MKVEENLNTICLVMIVKNESKNIKACLESAKPYISNWVIVDTGSTDDTKEIIRLTMEGIPGILHDSPWKNFGVNRSQALAWARGFNSGWLLLLDADMTVWIDPAFVPDHNVEAYTVAMEDSGTNWRLPLFVNGNLMWQYIGACHEYLAPDPNRPYKQTPTDSVRVKFNPTQTWPAKQHWYAGLLEEDLLENPNNPRTIFYLAQTYREMGDTRARDLYLKRADMGGFEEEAWYAQYRAALLAEWPTRMVELLKVWQRRSTRLEPLYDLVKELNQQKLHLAAYVLSSVELTKCSDVLFVSNYVWDWGIDFEHSIASWWVGERAEFNTLSKKLLKNPRLPDNVREAVERNLSFK